MSLKQLPLDPYILAQLFSRPIIPDQDAPLPEDSIKVKFLGENRQNILLLVKNEQTAFLPEELFTFLVTILNACRLTVKDIAIVNTAHYPGIPFPLLARQFDPQACILFGDAIPLRAAAEVNNYIVQKENDCKLLQVDDLGLISENRYLKGKLWTALQKLFDLS